RGFELPAATSRPARGGESPVVQRRHTLDREQDRARLAKELPPEAAALTRNPVLVYFQQARLAVPLDPSEGDRVRIAVVLETEDGRASPREVMRLRRPAGKP